MRCFGFASPLSRSSPSPQRPSPREPPPAHPPRRPPSSSSAAHSEDGEGADPHDAATPRSAATSPSPTTFNLLAREYTLAVQTHSYAEIWSKIHTFSSSAARGGPGPGEGEEGDRLGRREEEEDRGAALSSSAHLIGEVLRPDRGSVDEALHRARPGRLSRLVSDYFDSSEHTSRLCLRLHRCVDHARSIYAPLHDLLDVLPTPAATAATTPASSPLSSSSPSRNHQHAQAHHRLHHHLSQTQCERAFDIFQEFSGYDNPFPAPGSAEEDGSSFKEMRRCFAQLKQQLDHRLRRARGRARLLRRTTAGSALCLVGTAVAITVSGLIIALHALPALAAAAGPLIGFLRLPPGDPLAARQRRLREHIAQLDAAARGTYVLNNDLDTIERLVARLHATVESDRVLVRLGLSRERGDRHPIEQVVRQLRRNRRGLLEQLHDLEEHVCLCFAAINRARSLLLQHICSHQPHHHHHHHHYNGIDRRNASTSAANEEEVDEVQVGGPA